MVGSFSAWEVGILNLSFWSNLRYGHFHCVWISQITLSPPTFYDVGAWIRI